MENTEGTEFLRGFLCGLRALITLRAVVKKELKNSPYAVPQDLSCAMTQHECCGTRQVRKVS